jgi:hypothetical protein
MVPSSIMFTNDTSPLSELIAIQITKHSLLRILIQFLFLNVRKKLRILEITMGTARFLFFKLFYFAFVSVSSSWEWLAIFLLFQTSLECSRIFKSSYFLIRISLNLNSILQAKFWSTFTRSYL